MIREVNRTVNIPIISAALNDVVPNQAAVAAAVNAANANATPSATIPSTAIVQSSAVQATSVQSAPLRAASVQSAAASSFALRASLSLSSPAIVQSDPTDLSRNEDSIHAATLMGLTTRSHSHRCT